MNDVLFSSKSDEYGTPLDLYSRLNNIFKFTLDPAATDANAKCDNYYTAKDNGLILPWDGHNVFINPPYSKQRGVSQAASWCEKAAYENHNYAVMLLPARTDTRMWHELVFPHTSHIVFISGRLRFTVDGIESDSSAPFPSAICVFPGKSRISRSQINMLRSGGLGHMLSINRGAWWK